MCFLASIEFSQELPLLVDFTWLFDDNIGEKEARDPADEDRDW